MTTKPSKEAMEDVLREAVARMNHAEPRAEVTGASASDPVRLATAVLSKLLENNEGRESMAEKLDELREDLKGGGEHALITRKYLQRIMKTQAVQLAELRQLRVELHALHTQSSALGDAVVDIYELLSRLQLVEQSGAEVAQSGFPPPRVSGAPARPEAMGHDVSAQHTSARHTSAQHTSTKRRAQRTP